MDNTSLPASIEQFAQRGVDYLQSQKNEALSKIQENITNLNQVIEDSSISMAVSPWRSIGENEIPSALVAPDRMRIGSLQLINHEGVLEEGVELPFLLPMKENAILLNIGEDADQVPSLFQNIILRLLLSMRMDLLKVSIVDMDFGSSFPVISTIKNSMFKHDLSYRQEDVNKLIDQLAQEINEANKNILGRYGDIDEYNAASGEMAYPYRFVFIDDFPNGFTPQSIDTLLRLIDNGNAMKAGIRIFLNYSEKNPQPREFDLSRIMKSCACISKNDSGHILLQNFSCAFPTNLTAKLELERPEKETEYVDYINTIKPRSVAYSLDGWIDDLKNNDLVWKGSTVEGINVPIGFITPSQHFNFYMANDKDGSCNDFFALIAGRPGYGKTVLLHNIIVNAAMKYSPDELCLYLADFAEGASFSIYRELPHVKSIMLANNKEYALRMLEDVVQEAKRRAHLYQRAQKQYGKQITKLSDYREVTNEKLPRILFIMDEFHTLFLSTDDTTSRAKEQLCNGIRQWRKFGISIILCTQSITGVQFGNAETQITYRFALNLLEMDSKSVIRNDVAKTLTRKGQTIMNNTADGRVDSNVEFQSAFTEDYYKHVQYLVKLYEEKYGKQHRPYICESGVYADITDNVELTNMIKADSITPNPLYCDVYVGKPDLLRNTHTRLRYRRQQNSNTLIIGDDYRTLVYNIMTQMIQMRYQSPEGSRFYIINCFNVGDPFQGALNGIDSISKNFVTGQSQEITDCVDMLYEELERRKAAQVEGIMIEERIALAILNAQNCYDLRSRTGRSSGQTEVTQKLVSLLSEGAPLGIHCIVHGLSHETLFKTNGILDSSKHLSMFENFMLLKGADNANIFTNGINKMSAPIEEGQIIVLNAKIDGEAYEQCNAYFDIALPQTTATTKFMSNIFEKFN